MAQKADYAKDLTEIRSLMERSSRFISLSGLSGVFAGLFALAGAAAAYLHLNHYQAQNDQPTDLTRYDQNFISFFFLDAFLVIFFSVIFGVYFTTRNARKKGQTIFDRTALRLIINMAIPLVAGGVFCLALLYQHALGLIAPAMLLFYGVALINGSKYSLNDIRYLGLCELALGLAASFFIGYGLLFWAIGFGVLHIIYGTAMYFKYDQK